NGILGDYFVEASEAANKTFDANQEFYQLAAAGNLSAEAMRTLAVDLGIMTPAEADAYFATAILKGEILKLSGALNDGSLAAEDADLALDALTSGYADNAAEALEAAKNAKIFGDSIADIPDVTVKKLVFEISQTGDITVAQKSDPFGPAISSHYGGPAAAGEPHLVGDGPGGRFIPGATELFIPGQSGYIVSNRQVEQALSTINNNHQRTITFNDNSRISIPGGTRRAATRLNQARRRQFNKSMYS
ncbi:MAG: hypothetical protein KDE04_22360, partial [Anaerolineales bacterium]|nr:hypothetical protein [Anaerolineales bacterium]